MSAEVHYKTAKSVVPDISQAADKRSADVAADVPREKQPTISTRLAWALKDRALKKDLDACAEGVGLFQVMDDALSTALQPAYVIYLHLLIGGKEAWQEVLNHSCFEGRKRRPKKGTEALVAVLTRVSGADAEGRRRDCYDYAYALIWAYEHEVPPDEFAEQVPSMRECKAFVRNQRRPDDRPGRKQSSSKVVITSGGRCSFQLALDPEQSEAVKAYVEQHNVEVQEELLNVILDLLTRDPTDAAGQARVIE